MLKKLQKQKLCLTQATPLLEFDAETNEQTYISKKDRSKRSGRRARTLPHPVLLYPKTYIKC